MVIENNFDFSKLFDTLPIPRLVFNVEGGKATNLLQINKLALRYFNCKQSQAINLPLKDFMSPDNARNFEQSFQVCISKKRMVTIQALPTVPGALKVYGFWINPIMADDGEVIYIDVVGQPDVSNQSIIQRERDDAMSFLASVFEVSEVGIIVTDDNGKIVRANESFIRTYGWSRDDVIGSEYLSLIEDKEKDRMRINHDKFKDGSLRSTGEVNVLRKDGAVANVLFTSAVLRLSQDRSFLVTTVMDITERKKMEQSMRLAKDQADTANRSKSVFLANMSHELRTPLNAIIGFSELMIKEVFGIIGNDKYKEYLGDIHMSAEHLLDIINEVLDMSKIEAGRIELVDDDFHIRDVIISVSRMLSSRVFASNIEIVREIGNDIPMVRADYRLIRQVLINLISNAIKFSPQGSQIKVVAEMVDSGDLLISVSDEGLGIAKDKIQVALEPFGQVSGNSDARTVNQQGTGLGLPLAKAMVELHGGIFELISEENAGTTARFTLPKSRLIPKN